MWTIQGHSSLGTWSVSFTGSSIPNDKGVVLWQSEKKLSVEHYKQKRKYEEVY